VPSIKDFYGTSGKLSPSNDFEFDFSPEINYLYCVLNIKAQALFQIKDISK